ncbi:DNA cytosine methyltransferase [Chitiniphilus shinanonensis]|uniref:DNA cytosine methyltransferase n=1 Tax=Chitiniphilus shinanonensis TaxID=553088 RepID=UPI00303F676D
MIREQFRLLMDNELIVDLFAGGGGMSVAIEQALGRAPDIAINHSEQALSMHQANHQQTSHYIADVYEVCPREATNGVAVGYLHLSPDCTHHSQAAGGQPRSRKIRGLAWVGYRWAGQVAPRVISLENVKQILQWGPLVAKRDRATGRVMKLDGSVAAPGERVPVQQQYLIPDPKRAGITWRRFVRALETLGYAVEWQVLNAADHGAPTTRERLFMIARRDGKPIAWPAPTHFKNPDRGQKRWRAAAEGIDFSLQCPSIFERKKPLADATLRRIAKGLQKFVIDAAEPFIVPVTHQGGDRAHSINEPLHTVTAAHRGELALVAPTLVQAGYGERTGQSPRALDLQQPLGTIVAGGIKHALAAASLVRVSHGEGKPGGVKRWGNGCRDIQLPLGTVTASGGGGYGISTAYMMQANGGYNTTPGRDLREPASTITNTGSQQQLVTAFLTSYYTDDASRCRDVRDPTATITTENRLGLVQCTLAPDDEARALRCAAFLISYYGTDNMSGPGQPLPTITTRDRLALVTVWIRGEPWVIVNIGLRMLTPAELYACQGFPADYKIERGHDGRVFSKSDQVRMCGNSVSPPPATAFIRTNLPELAVWTPQEIRQRERAIA